MITTRGRKAKKKQKKTKQKYRNCSIEKHHSWAKDSKKQKHTYQYLSVYLYSLQSVFKLDSNESNTLTLLSIWEYNYDGFSSHIWILSTRNYTIYVSRHNWLYLSRCLKHFNGSQGNGLFNLASELGWILWLRIWQFYFHTLRKVMILHASVVALR